MRLLVVAEIMNDYQLERNLRSVGKEIFVAYFEQFNDPQVTNKAVASLLFDECSFTWKSCQSRTSHARSIIREGRAIDALENIRDSEGVRDPATKDKATSLLNSLN